MQVLNQHGGLPVALARALTRQLLQALTLLHSYGVVHRDVKPENLMVNFHEHPSQCDPAAVQLCLIDFGWAGIAKDRAAATLTSLAGSPGYCAPEVLAWAEEDEEGLRAYKAVIPRYSSACDIFSAGATVYVMISSDMPYSDDEDPSTTPLRFSTDWDSPGLASAQALVRSLLTIAPTGRPTAEEALELLFLTEVPDERQSGKGRLLREKQRQASRDDVAIQITSCTSANISSSRCSRYPSLSSVSTHSTVSVLAAAAVATAARCTPFSVRRRHTRPCTQSLPGIPSM